MREFRGAYRNERYAGLYEPMRRAMAAMGKAMWWFAALKEQTWYQGYAGVTAAIHALEHKQPEYIDELKDIMAKLGLPLSYPPIPELDMEYPGLSGTFDMCIGLLDEVNDALSGIVEVCDTANDEPLARYAENVQMENFQDRQWLVEANTMAENGDGSTTSYDSWFVNILKAPQKQ